MRKEDWIRRGVLLAVGIVVFLFIVFEQGEKETKDQEATPVETAVPQEPQDVIQPEPTINPEERIYSFFQGPKAWEKRLPWSGKWSKEEKDGSKFGAFGCGFCCMANIYSSLSDYVCSPVDIYEYTKDNTLYQGGCAVSWEQMEKILGLTGFQVKLGKKPSSYQAFCEKMKECQSMLVLVSSSEDDEYWQDTPGHYVTLFLFDEEAKDVFLCDSGNIEHNRSRVSLKTIYKALKTSSDYQLMTISGYQEELNQWKHNGIQGTHVNAYGEVEES